MAFEHIINPLLEAGMIELKDDNGWIIYDYTRKALDKIGEDISSWHFCTIHNDEEPNSIKIWLPGVVGITDDGDSFGGFKDVDSYKYKTVKDVPEELFNSPFEEKVKILFEGLGVPYNGGEVDYIELDDLCL